MIAEQALTRIALLADTFHEVNGAARTCREWEAFARRHEVPFLCVRWGSQPGLRYERSVQTLELARSRCAVPIDPDLRFDPLLHRALAPIEKALEWFRPEVIHITSPGDLGIIGAILAERLKIPLALSWHTNLHEFAARRVSRIFGWMGRGVSEFAARNAERFVMDRVCWFFGRGAAIFAPNPELASLLRARTGKPVLPMGRGIDTTLFHPARRQRGDDALVLGYVGRLMPEKNLHVLARVAAALGRSGITNFRFQISGAGSERPWLESNLPEALFTGVLRGEPLAQAYANLDIFLFPSRTDTFGNVVQEAMASGVPAVVMDAGGPRFIVREGASGFIASDDAAFCDRAVALARDAALRRGMAVQARRQVEGQSWDRVFTEVYDGYARLLQPV
jgi:glycosyltransferase involved in cell wall biosynthesis